MQGLNVNFSKEQEVLHSDFDLQTHVKTFVYYCEVIMWPDGKVEYAIPSHVEKLIAVYADKKGMTVSETKDMLRKETCYPYYRRIMDELSIMFVWYDSVFSTKKPTKDQLKMLSDMLLAGCISDKAMNDIKYI